MNLVELNSVGSVISIEDGIVYPQLENGLPDLDCGVHIYKVTDEWFEALNERDINLLIKIGVYEILE